MHVKLSGLVAGTSCLAGITNKRIFLSPQATGLMHPWVLLMAGQCNVQLESEIQVLYCNSIK